MEFKNHFYGYYHFVLNVKCLSTDAEAQQAFNLTYKAAFEILEREIKLVEYSMHMYDFQEIKIRVEIVFVLLVVLWLMGMHFSANALRTVNIFKAMSG